MSRILCILLIIICLLATTMETLSTSYKREKAETAEKNDHISMEKDANERMPLLSHVTTKVEKNEGKISAFVKVSSLRLSSEYRSLELRLSNRTLVV